MPYSNGVLYILMNNTKKWLYIISRALFYFHYYIYTSMQDACGLLSFFHFFFGKEIYSVCKKANNNVPKKSNSKSSLNPFLIVDF